MSTMHTIRRTIRGLAPVSLLATLALSSGCQALGLAAPKAVTSEQVLGKLEAGDHSNATQPGVAGPEIVALPAPPPPAPAVALLRAPPLVASAPRREPESFETTLPASLPKKPGKGHAGKGGTTARVGATGKAGGKPLGGGGKTYVIARGDTLQKISHKFYGTTTRWQGIFDANKAKLKRPDLVVVGTKITIP